jgi:hypothetical protein
MVLPNFLIVGAAKSGTTSLYNYLGQHPDIYFPEVKEPHYFSDSNTYMARNLGEYQGLFSKNKGEKALGEASVSYLFDPTSPGKILETLGKIKCIASLRNPVNRAYSHWQHFYNVGWEDLPFREALAAEDERFSSATFRQSAPALVPSGYFYFRRGLYADQVERYLACFGPQNVKIMIFEQWIQDLPGTCRRLFEFLDVDPTFQPDLAVVNPAHRTRSQGLHDLLVTHRPKWITNLYQNAPLWLRDLIYRTGKRIYWANMTEAQKQPMPPDLRQALLEKYLPEIHRLEDLLQTDLSLWYGE